MKQILLALFLVGCSSELKIVNPDGSTSYQLSCRRNMNECFEDVKEVCHGQKFKVISITSTPGVRRENVVNTYTVVATCQ